MQRLFFEKQIDLNHALQELISVSVNENLAYQDDPEGKRAVGTLDISGDYLRIASRDRFNDQIEIDVLAPFERLEDDEDFHLEVQDFDYHIQNGNLTLEIQVIAHGVGEKKERHIIVDAPDENEQEILQEIQNLVTKAELEEAIEEELQEKTDTLEIVTNEEDVDIGENEEIRENEDEAETIISEEKDEETEKNTNEMITEETNTEVIRDQEETKAVEYENTAESSEVIHTEESQLSSNEVLEAGSEESLETEWQDYESVDVEDLFDDSVMAFITYPIYIVQVGDSYEKIAQHYQIDTETLMDYNQHISLKPHQLLVIPPR